MYGTEDDFVLNDTDVMLIAHATRGYLDGPGGIALGAALVATTAIAGSRLLVRMEILPVYIVAAALCFYTAYRRGPADGVAHAVFGAFVVSRALSVVCAVY